MRFLLFLLFFTYIFCSNDISAQRIRHMTDIVRELDQLSTFFDEKGLEDEDDFLAIKEDPKIAYANSNLASAVHRLENDVRRRPHLFEDDRHLYDIEHYLNNPVPLQHAVPSSETDNLDYLRDLRNYVTSLKQNELRK